MIKRNASLICSKSSSRRLILAKISSVIGGGSFMPANTNLLLGETSERASFNLSDLFLGVSGSSMVIPLFQFIRVYTRSKRGATPKEQDRNGVQELEGRNRELESHLSECNYRVSCSGNNYYVLASQVSLCPPLPSLYILRNSSIL